MSLSNELSDVDLTFKCASCGYRLVRTGSWFLHASGFKCAGCRSQQRITYDDKMKLFARHMHLALRADAQARDNQ
jgi:hypothetical protein